MLELRHEVLEPAVVIDDDPEAAFMLETQLRMLGAQQVDTISSSPLNPSLDYMLDQVQDYRLVVCDHKLNQRFRVNFYGVNLAAEAAHRDQASILVTGQLPNEM